MGLWKKSKYRTALHDGAISASYPVPGVPLPSAFQGKGILAVTRQRNCAVCGDDHIPVHCDSCKLLIALFSGVRETCPRCCTTQRGVMAPIRRYVRISKYSVLECRIFLENPADGPRWLLNTQNPALSRVFEAVRPLILPKLREENQRAKGKGKKKKSVKDVVKGGV